MTLNSHARMSFALSMHNPAVTQIVMCIMGKGSGRMRHGMMVRAEQSTMWVPTNGRHECVDFYNGWAAGWVTLTNGSDKTTTNECGASCMDKLNSLVTGMRDVSDTFGCSWTALFLLWQSFLQVKQRFRKNPSCNILHWNAMHCTCLSMRQAWSLYNFVWVCFG